MKKQYDVAIVGATGTVGEVFLQILVERKFPIRRIFALASERSAGDTVTFNGNPILVEDTAGFDFAKSQIALFSAGSAVSAKYAPIATAKNCVCIDNTAHFRRDPSVPLVITEVNAEDIEKFTVTKIIANPNCSTMQMLVALKPIYDAVGITRINVATYQSVSGAGKEGIEELAKQTADMLTGKPLTKITFPVQIAFNLLPHIDVFQENGYTREEMKMHWETQKILHDDNIKVNATAVRVPVFYGHSEAVHIETAAKISAADAKKLLQKAAGVKVIDEHENGGYPTAVTHASGKDLVYVGRIREDISHERGLNLWVVSDNIRKGAALNAIQIAEHLIHHYL